MSAPKGVILEYDFAAMDGAGLLYGTTSRFLENLDGIPFDERVEARYLAGRDYLTGLAEYFAVVKTKKTCQKAAKDLAAAFAADLAEAVPKSVTQAFRGFIKRLDDAGIKTVIVTRADVGAVEATFSGLLSERVVLHHEESSVYGSLKWDAWRRICVPNRMRFVDTLVITGSGHGVKAALLAGMSSMAVIREHNAYQDTSGADAVVGNLDAAAAKAAFRILRI